MKKTLIMGVCLLISGAAIYGFVDYMKTDKKQLEDLYKEDLPAAKVAPTEVKKAGAPTEEKQAAVVNSVAKKEKPVSVKKKAPKEEEDKIFTLVEGYSRARPVKKFVKPVEIVDTAVVVKEDQH